MDGAALEQIFDGACRRSRGFLGRSRTRHGEPISAHADARTGLRPGFVNARTKTEQMKGPSPALRACSPNVVRPAKAPNIPAPLGLWTSERPRRLGGAGRASLGRDRRRAAAGVGAIFERARSVARL